MKSLLTPLCATPIFAICSAAIQAPIYLSWSRQQDDSPDPRSISPRDARLLFAHRLGLSEFHTIGDVEDYTLDVLNDYGRDGEILFLNGDQSQHKSYLYIIEGVENPEDIFDHDSKPSLFMQHPPHAIHNKKLVDDLSVQSMQVSSGHRPGSASHFRNLVGLSRKDGPQYSSAAEVIKSILNRESQHKDIITLLIPAHSAENTQTRSPYGTYSMPQKSHHHSTKAHKREQEEPLEPFLSPSEPASSSPSISQSDDDSSDTNATSPTPLPHSVLRICHDTADLAVSETNNCSGHGNVYLRSASDDTTKSPDCYACKCSTTVIDIPNKKSKTVHWGGPACQKKDVSAPFWLLGGVTVGLIGAITWGVGLLMSIGNEDLPGVIAAGVSGPTAGK